MSQPLFEQYKDALRRGHAALLEGRLDEAVTAYAAAARLVPDRALPHASAAAALVQLGRPAAALEALDRAMALAPDDEATLRARAAVLRELGRDADAAADIERLTAVRASGRQDEALPTASPLVDPARDPELLVVDAAAMLATGSTADARARLLEAVAVHRAAGRPDAALDVCFGLLEIAPGDPAVHLAIANVQLDRGWQALAADKIRLLLQLTTLTGDTRAAADTHALAAERLRDDPAAVAGAG